MSEASALDYPVVCPYLFYEDVAAALEFLSRAFGFRERMRTTNADGSLSHCEMEVEGGGVIMLGTPPGYKNPAHLGQVTVGMYVSVSDVDTHWRRSKDAGATVEADPTDQEYGVRSYGAQDPEGHQWWFSQPLSS